MQMLILFGFILSFIILIFVAIKGLYIGYGISLSFLIFAAISLKLGKSFKEIGQTALTGGKKAFVVLKVFMLIGLVTASWLIAGTIPSIVYYCMKILNPSFFILFAFLATSMVGYILGTSMGVASTIGIVLMIMARGGDINLNLIAGAILSGCYFGDRTSPMSSSAALVANQTGVEFYPMLKGFRRTTYIPFLIVSLIYLILSLSNPLNNVDSNILTEIKDNFTVNYIVLLPAIVMLILSIFQINVKKSMVISIITGVIMALIVQGASFVDIIKTLIFGFRMAPENPLVNIIKGGGLISMLKACFVVFVSCSMAGLFEGMDLFNRIGNLFRNVHTRAKIFMATGITAFISACFGGNQSIAIVMTSEIMKKVYEDNKIEHYELAIDLANTAVLFAAIIPWNIACLIPANALDVHPASIVPYSFYLFIPFIYNYIKLHIKLGFSCSNS